MCDVARPGGTQVAGFSQHRVWECPYLSTSLTVLGQCTVVQTNEMPWSRENRNVYEPVGERFLREDPHLNKKDDTESRSFCNTTHINSHIIVYKLYKGVVVSLKRRAGSPWICSR